MKVLLLICLLFSVTAFAKELKLENSKISYEVKYLTKTVIGESKESKGKMVCENKECDFLVAAPVKSFVSSDSNRDLNMLTILEATKYPVVTVKGKLPEEKLSEKQYQFNANVSFHGVEKEYPITVSGNHGKFTVNLENHKIDRPSLLTVKIDNEVPISFEFNWK